MVALLNVNWDAYTKLSPAERQKFQIRWERLVNHEAAILSRFLNGRPLKQSSFDALLSFRMSIPSWDRFKNTRVARFLQDEDWDMVPLEFHKFCTVNGVWDDKLEYQHRIERQTWDFGMYPEMPEDVWSID